MQLSEKEYERTVSAVRDVLKFQELDNPPGALLMPDLGRFYTVDDWKAHNLDKYFPMYFHIALLYTLKDEEGEYIYQPKCLSASEEQELEASREYLREALERNIEIK